MILVAGATGTLGGMVAHSLLARGHDVRVLVRPGADWRGLAEAGAETVTGDLKDPASLVAACRGVTTVITTANSAARGGADTSDSVDRLGNRALIDAARGAGVEHFVFVSALGASQDSPVEFLRAKAETERHLQESGMLWTVLQPNLFMEVWAGMLVVAPIMMGEPLRFVEPASQRHTFVSIRDVAALTVAAVVDPGARNRVIAFGGPDALTWLQVAEVAERVAGRSVEVELVPPGSPLGNLPETVVQLAAALETYDTDVDWSGVAAEFGVRLTPVDAYLAAALATPATA